MATWTWALLITWDQSLAQLIMRSTWLFLVHVVKGSSFRDGLPVVHTWLPDLDIHIIFPSHALHIDVKVKLPHPTDDGLTSVLIKADLQPELIQQLHWGLTKLGTARIGNPEADEEANRSLFSMHRNRSGLSFNLLLIGPSCVVG